MENIKPGTILKTFLTQNNVMTEILLMGMDVAQPARLNRILTALNPTTLSLYVSKNAVFFLKRLKLRNVTMEIRSAGMDVVLLVLLRTFTHAILLESFN